MKNSLPLIALIWSAVVFAPPVFGAIIGTNPPAAALTNERLNLLPASARVVWKTYLDRSNGRRRQNQLFFQKEMQSHGITNSSAPPSDHSARSMPLNRPPAWYQNEEAGKIADHIVSFQTPAGGWSKNLNLATDARIAGEQFGPENGSHHLINGDFDAPLEGGWDYIGTIDNDATTTELQFLAKVIAATGKKENAKYRAAFLRGADYLLAAQYPNGGWPQVWPLQGGYHDAITINDGAMLNVLKLLRDVSERENEYGFVPARDRLRARAGFKRGLDLLLSLQVKEDRRRTIWCQQYDCLTLLPCSARNYEMPALTTGESAEILEFLMKLPKPRREIVVAVHAAAAWFEKNKLMNIAFENTGVGGRQLISKPGNGPLWARYYQIGDDQPVFGDRDKTIHDKVNEISLERRNGYSWYGAGARRVLEDYARWSKLHPLESKE